MNKTFTGLVYCIQPWFCHPEDTGSSEMWFFNTFVHLNSQLAGFSLLARNPFPKLQKTGLFPGGFGKIAIPFLSRAEKKNH
jgi:hypothetical protein